MSGAYWVRAMASNVRNLRSSPGFARDLANSGLRYDGEPKAPTRFVLDLFPEAERVAVDMGTVTYRRSNLDPMEQYVLAIVAKLSRPGRIFELGTFDGATTLLLARNAPGAEIVTIDLAPDEADRATVSDERANVAGGAGQRFRGQPEAERITQLLGDTRTFDFSPYHGTIDLVLVDAGHDYDCAKADTEAAYKLLAPGGIIVWDDYQPGWPGVVRAVDGSDDVRRSRLVHIGSTDFALYREPGRPA